MDGFDEFTPYLPGASPGTDLPLGRFLPPVPTGVAARWLERHVPPGSWVLDPFGTSPRMIVEAARAGYRVLVAANNPILRFFLVMYADPPRTDEMSAALAALAAARTGEERLEPHLLNLYATRCHQCGAAVSAEAFLWEREATGPYARIYSCPHCKTEGEFPATPADLENAARYAASGLHRARALERVAPLNDPDRRYAEEALRVYRPRAVYALFTLLNRMEGLPLAPRQKRILTALLISAFDQANTLWPHPTARARPKKLIIPPHYRENNIWFALEQAIPRWTGEEEATPVEKWPNRPPVSGGITIFQRRLKNLPPLLPEIEIQAVLTAIPRPNQAFWTLSALWAGWLWGKEATGPFKGVLRRRRYDWVWHTTALAAAFGYLSDRLPPGTPIFSVVPEAEPGLVSATLMAADRAGFQITGAALRAGSEQAQFTWKLAPQASSSEAPPPREVGSILKQAAKEVIRARGEPTAYLVLHSAGLTALARQNQLTHSNQTAPQVYTGINEQMQAVFSYRSGFLRYGGSHHSPEIGQWWVREETDLAAPLADRVEAAFLDYLGSHPGSTFTELDAALCNACPGWLTPESDLIVACLDSYGEKSAPPGNTWQLRAPDAPEARARDLQEMADILTRLGRSLGYQVRGTNPLFWEVDQEEPKALFHILSSANIGNIVFNRGPVPHQAYIVLPGGRANLVAFKLRSDPRLNQTIENRWQFIKYRLLRRLVNSHTLTRENLGEQFSLDPLTYASPQMVML